MTDSPLPDVGIELREGYAEVDDQSLHYVEAGEGPLIVLLHGFPEFWFGWRLQIEPLVAAGFRVVAPDTRGYNLSSKPEDFEAYAVDLLAADIRGLIGELGAEVRAVGRSRLGRKHRLDHRDEPPRGGRPTRHPQCGPSAAALGGTPQPEPAQEVLVLLLLCDTGTARGRGARQKLAFLPTLPERREPALHAGGNRTLRRGVVAARGSSRDDQLLPRLGKTVPEGGRRKVAPALGADTGHLGRARFLPRLRPRRAGPRRRAQPRPRGAPGRRVALGASRRG